jgi:SAM-dependent methyltransferase
MLEAALRSHTLQRRHLRDIRGILQRVGYYKAWDTIMPSRAPNVERQPDTRALRDDNPRLQELRARYKQLPWDVLDHVQWSPEYVLLDVPLQQFRRDCAFLWQERDLNLPIHYVCTYLYCQQPRFADLLSLCTEDGEFGASVVTVEGECITRDRLDSVLQLDFLRSVLKLSSSSELTVLDIGSGYGRLAYRMAQCFPQFKVLCVDAIPESTFLCDFYLNFRGVTNNTQVIPLYDLYSALSHRRIDIALAINSLSECSTRAVSWWINVLKMFEVPYLMVVPTPGSDNGRSLLNPDKSKSVGNDFGEMLVESGYKQVCSSPKYEDPSLEKYGVSPTHFHLFGR